MMRELTVGAAVVMLATLGTPGLDASSSTTGPSATTVSSTLPTTTDTVPTTTDTVPTTTDTPPTTTGTVPTTTDTVPTTTDVPPPTVVPTPPSDTSTVTTSSPPASTTTPPPSTTVSSQTSATTSTPTVTTRVAPLRPPIGGIVHIYSVPPIAGVHLVVGGIYVTTGPGGYASVSVASFRGIAAGTQLAGGGGAIVSLTKSVQRLLAPGSLSLAVGFNVTATVRLSVTTGSASQPPGSIHALRLHSSDGGRMTIDPTVTPIVQLLSERTSLQHGQLIARAVTWKVDSVRTGLGGTLTAGGAAFQPGFGGTWSIALRPVMGQVHITTVPAMAGVRLIVAGVAVTTAPGGVATVSVTDLAALSKKVQLSSRTAGTDTVEITRVVRDPSPRGSRSLTVGLNVTVPVRLSIVAGSSGVEPGSVHAVRLHSIDGHIVTVDPSTTTVVPLLAERTVLQHGRLVVRAITWTVDSVTASPGVAVTVSRAAFDPSLHDTWLLTLQPVAGTVRVETVPAIPGVHLVVAGVPVTTAQGGVATVAVPDVNNVAKLVTLASTDAGGETVAIHRVERIFSRTRHQRGIVVALAVTRPVTLTFSDPNGRAVPADKIASVTLRGDGRTIVLRGAALVAPVDLTSQVPELAHGHWQIRPAVYSASDVHLDGSNAVFTGRQRFEPATAGTWHISLALYKATIRVTDALFGGALASTAALTAPDNRPIALDIPAGGATLPSTVRGMYTLTVNDAVLGRTNQILISGNLSADIRVVTAGDLVLAGGAGVVVAVALILLGALIARRNRGDVGRDTAAVRRAPSRASHARRWALRAPRWRHRWASTAIALMGVGVVVSTVAYAPSASAATASTAATAAPAAPAFVYFYQWFTSASWARAKEDMPLIGNYSSADPAVLRTQLSQMKAAGINGILTSWKNDAQLDNNLQLLIDQAGPAGMDLGVVYEALDFSRRPLPVTVVQSDMTSLVNRWGSALRSRYFRLPLIIWTGTNAYTPAQVRAVHDALAGRALLLAASKTVSDYQAIASDVDGEAYYWSSSDPAAATTASKLAAMGAAVRSHGGIWIAPAAAGFDGRTLGHSRVIARNGGQSLVLSLNDAYASDPTAVGVISWNEWSENTYIEPGKRYGTTELSTLATYLHGIRAGAAHPAPAASASGPPPTSATTSTSEPTGSSAAGQAGGSIAAAAPSTVADQVPAPSPSTARASVARRGWAWPLAVAVAALVACGIVVGVVTRRRSLRRKGARVG